MSIFESIKSLFTKQYLNNQVDSVFSLFSTYSNDNKNISELFDTYNKILRNQTSEEFQKSIINTKYSFEKQCKGDLKVYSVKIKELELNNPDSFLIVPMASNDHCFCAVVRKTQEGYSATLVNASKGGRREPPKGIHAAYEEYIFEEKNLNKLLYVLDTTSIYKANLDPLACITSAEIYKSYNFAADKKYNLNVVSRDQKDGNCFVKEPEKAIKYAFATRSFNQKQLNNLREFNQAPFKPKWTPCTEEIHKLYIEQLKKENPHSAKKLQKKYEKYLEYKNFAKEEMVNKMPCTGRSMKSTSKVEMHDNYGNVTGVAKLQKDGNWTFFDESEKVVGYSTEKKDRTNYFDTNHTFIGFSKVEGVGEKYFNTSGKMIGYTRSYTGMKDIIGVVSQEHKGKLAFDTMLELSKVQDKTPLQAKLIQRRNQQQVPMDKGLGDHNKKNTGIEMQKVNRAI